MYTLHCVNPFYPEIYFSKVRIDLLSIIPFPSAVRYLLDFPPYR